MRRKRINEYLLEKVRDKNEKAKILGDLSTVLYHAGELDKALEFVEKTLKIFKDMGNRIESARTLMNIGDVFVLKSDKERALDYYLKAINGLIQAYSRSMQHDI